MTRGSFCALTIAETVVLPGSYRKDARLVLDQACLPAAGTFLSVLVPTPLCTSRAWREFFALSTYSINIHTAIDF